MREEEFNRKCCQEQGTLNMKYLEGGVGSQVYGVGKQFLAEGTAYIKVWGITKWPIWEQLRSEVGTSSKGCVVGQVTGDVSKIIVFKVLWAKAFILNLP